MREKAMMLSTSGEESRLLAQLILIPVGVLLIVGIVFLCCKYNPCCSDSKQLKAGKGARRDFTSGVKTRIIRTDSPSAAGQVKRSTARRSSPQNDPSAVASTLSYDPAHGKNKVNDPQRRTNQHDAASITNNTSSDVTSGPPQRQYSPESAASAFAAAIDTSAAAAADAAAATGQQPLPQEPASSWLSSVAFDEQDSGEQSTSSSSGSSGESRAEGSAAEASDVESAGSLTLVDLDPKEDIFLDIVNLNSPHYPIPVNKLKTRILRLYEEYDADNDGHIDHFELKSFFQAVESRSRLTKFEPMTDQDVSEVLDAFDDNRNGTLEKAEFCTWILSGLSKSAEERAAFASSKPLARKLNNFLDQFVAYVLLISPESQPYVSSPGEGKNNVAEVEEVETIVDLTPIFTKTTSILKGHKHWVETVAVSSNGHSIYSGGVDAKIRLWDARTGKNLRKLISHKNVVTSLACPPDGSALTYHLVSGSVDKSIRLWNVITGQTVGKLKGHTKGVTSVAISATNPNIICSGSTDHTAAIWDARANKRIRKLIGHRESVDACAISIDGELLCTASEDGTLRVWDLATGQCLNVCRSHKDAGWIYSIDFSPGDRNVLCVGTHKHTVEVWDISGNQGGKLLQVLTGHRDAVMSVGFSKNGSKIISGGMDNDMRLWETGTGNNLGCYQGHTNMVTSVAFMPDDKHFLSGSRDHIVRVWPL